MTSGKESQRNSEVGHEGEQSGAGDEKSSTIPSGSLIVEAIPADLKNERYFAKFSNWVSLLTLLFVGAYTLITFVQWRGNQIFNKKQLQAINAQLAEMRASSRQTDQTISILRDQAEAAKRNVNALIDSERGRLFIGDITLKKTSDTDAQPKIDYSWINMGRGPVLINEVLVDCQLIGEIVPTTPVYDDNKARYGQTALGGGASGGTSGVPRPLSPCLLDQQLTPTNWEAIHKMHEFILFIGLIHYQDAFHKYRLNFGSIYRGDVEFFTTFGLPSAYNSEIQEE